MQLKHLKLSGFKSFADPTVLDFPSELVAVVGPNGCGKSNIIDAIRWVMGESSARQLRGESMEDVIFNGSSHRKPVGQASVEMVFDNSLGRFAGPYASYAEISIRRVVSRDGNSTWYLNGTRCRRKDILDLFSGTGARGYSIISQGEISRLIEARPEVLRAHLEEAAGVSLYKERRKETCNRIERTQENLARIADIRQELDKQLQRLEKQAKAAEQYQKFKQEEQYCKAEILALKQRDLSKLQSARQAEMEVFMKEGEQEHVQSLLSISKKDVLQEQLQQVQEQLQQVQNVFYDSGMMIARLQENLLQQQREKNQIIQDQQQIEADMQSAKSQKETCQNACDLAQEQVQSIQKNIEQAQEALIILDAAASQASLEKIALETLWQEKQTLYNQQSQEARLLQMTLDHNEQKRQEIFIRLEKISQEKQSIATEMLQDEVEKMQQQKALLLQEHHAEEANNHSLQTHHDLLVAQLQEIEKQIRQQDDLFRQLNTEHAALSAAQMAASRPEKPAQYPVQSFLSKPRLVDILQVDKEWQYALEYVLGDALKALVLESCDEFWPHLSQFSTGEYIATLSDNLHQKGLAAKIQGQIPCIIPSLESIHTANSLEEALLTLQTLDAHESIITPEGYWLGKGFIRIPGRSSETQSGLLERQKKIRQLQIKRDELEQALLEFCNQRDKLHEQLQVSEKALQTSLHELREMKEVLRTLESQLAAHTQRLLYSQTRMQNLDEEYANLEDSLLELQATRVDLSEKHQKIATEVQHLEQEQMHYTAEKKRLSEIAFSEQKKLDSAKDSLHQRLRELDRGKNQEEQAQAGIKREEERLILLKKRLEHINTRYAQIHADYDIHSENIQIHSARHHDLENQVQDLKNSQSTLNESMIQLDKIIKQHQASIQTLEEKTAEKRLEEQALAVRISALEESLNEQGFTASNLLETLDDSLNPKIKEDRLLWILDSISKLGAINLAAVEECQQTKARKDNLDEQYADLEEALLMLHTAIEKMDEETKTRLTDTFNQINDLFKALFPRLFGGGKAQLEWTGEEVLQAGVVVMAQPPGKRNSSIQLLSGGEKAMTAIALVFAIFQLNPAPFCMLDEVDAPLDEVNVSRFCNVVKEMSEFVQFLFITHNKTTMEMAKQLIGVTMREPGISRLVTVDIKQALTLE